MSCAYSWSTTVLSALLSFIMPICLLLGLRILRQKAESRAAKSTPHENEAEAGLAVPTQAGTQRIALLDNAKFLMMIAVVYTHSKTYWYWFAINFVNPFHIKCFAFMSGLMARKEPSAKKFKSLFYTLLVPNLLWCLVGFPSMTYMVNWRLPNDFHELVNVWYNGFFAGTAGTNWFLWGLLWWNFGGMLLVDLPPILRVIVATLVAAAGGYDSSGLFSFSMAITTLPVFVFGQVVPWERILALVPDDRKRRVLGVCMAIIFFFLERVPVGSQFINDIPQYSWNRNVWRLWWWDKPDATCDLPLTWTGSLWIRGAVFRNVLEVTKILLFLLYVCPRGESFMSRLGRYSLYPMLIHHQLMELELTWFADPGAASLPAPSNVPLALLLYAGQIVFCFGLTAVLSTRPVRAIWWVIIEPTWLTSCVAKIAKFESEGCLPRGQKGRGEMAKPLLEA
eukprot:TRINITY_DN4357_c0_g1_i1.p1 TRINITY_DN4357_c0_g1~~TRINITY_DN4357_c0_g1_i1.p1  ORF type:complete len:451 (-),score=42.70 TRINITY_DN4357_c0_g1_i1:48-1400(-)